MGKVAPVPIPGNEEGPALAEVLINTHGVPLTREAFHDFLTKGLSSEVLDFWTHSEQYRKETLGNSRASVFLPVVEESEKGERLRELLLQEFLAPNSVREVNLDHTLRDKVIEVVKDPAKDKEVSTATLDKAQVEAEAMMREPFIRFMAQVSTRNINPDDRKRRYGLCKKVGVPVFLILGGIIALEAYGLVPLYALRAIVLFPLWFVIHNIVQAYTCL